MATGRVHPEAKDLGLVKETVLVAPEGRCRWFGRGCGDNVDGVIWGDLVASRASVERPRRKQGGGISLSGRSGKGRGAITARERRTRCAARSQTDRSSDEAGVMPGDSMRCYRAARKLKRLRCQAKGPTETESQSEAQCGGADGSAWTDVRCEALAAVPVVEGRGERPTGSKTWDGFSNR